jgi:SulP family sulfate permease
MNETQRVNEVDNSTKARGFDTSGIGSDLSAAFTKAIDGVTGGLANAVLAGVNPVHGMYTVMIATPVGALFTSSVFRTSIRPARSQ